MKSTQDPFFLLQREYETLFKKTKGGTKSQTNDLAFDSFKFNRRIEIIAHKLY